MSVCRWVLHHLTLGSAGIKSPVSRVRCMLECWSVLHHLALGSFITKPSVESEMDTIVSVLHHFNVALR